ncbi:S-DNA-T family DNA segregation ATPase FtsK/SpoIIIE [Lederbergia galactosidilyticus]|uniref:DNA translocase FtsK n=1 Tax=Lederbergia galactosidilytica TaxID=217031 RepID=UPI001AE4533D|nr:DNA translocase FtsK [Lederbergia galactosidilytica]MBP1915339.1 S-DNA-T family DNA segregation ATPase FtsK/SpoIIIE [Lederbergia galactosidilytica]
MSWLKRFISKFVSEEHEEQEQPRKMDNSSQTSSSTMETRMTYQYPKGNFRFPLMQDPSDKQVPPNKGTPKNEYRERNDRKSERASVTKRETEIPKQKVYQEEVAEKQNKKVKSQLKQPFRPTHIPSPIFGYQRPEKNNTEYELQDAFLKKTPENEIKRETLPDTEEKVIPLTFIYPETEPQMEKNVETLEDKTPKIIIEEEFADLEPIKDEREEPSIEEMDSSLFIKEEIQEAESEKTVKDKAPKIVTEEESVDLDFVKDEGEEDPIEEMDSPLFIKEDVQEVGPEETAKDIASEMKIEERSTDLKPVEDEREELSIEEMDSPLFIKEEDPIVEQSLEEIQAKQSLEHGGTPSEEISRPTKRETTRAAMPFNVLMLKNDRKSWRERQEKQLEEPVRENRKSSLQVKNENIPSQKETVPHVRESEENQCLVENEQAASQEVYYYPDLSLLRPPVIKADNEEWLEEQKELLNETLINFNVQAQVVKVSQGPSVTRFEVQPERGVKVNKITNLSDDIKLSMAARDIRMEAPIPGKRTIGIEIPNQDSRPVQLSEIIGDPTFIKSESPLTAALGLDISGNPIVTDLQKMPHGLIAGATGSGKSVCINSILVSLLYKAKPDELKLLLIDPKMVELAPYNHIPHLVSPVITDVKAATASLKWAVEEMERRYELFAHTSVRNIGRYNELAEENRRFHEKLPYIVIIIDELADLMMMAPHDVEESICRIAQKARACGIHLIIATQRPSVDVITGLIKANVPTRVAFSVSSQVDSRTIIDISGAEKLLGRGDMLFLGSGSSKPVRLQGTFVSDGEIDRVIEHVRSQGDPDYLFEQEELLKKTQVQEEEDELYFETCEFVVKQGSASTSMLQRQFRIGYNRAARLIDMMEQQGVISGAKGSKPRDVLMTENELESLQESIL